MLRETYFIYVRHLKVWKAQPATIISALLTSAFIFLFFGAPLKSVTQLPGFPSDD